MKPLILYGAGKKAADAYQRFLEEGITPVCICDGNPKLHHTQIQLRNSTAKVLPLDEAFRLYPEAELYVTPNMPVKFEIMEHLLKFGIDQSRIINFEPFTKRRGCLQFEKNLVFEKSDIFLCCNTLHHLKIPSIPILDISNEHLWAKAEELREKAIYDIANQIEDGYCFGCPESIISYFPDVRHRHQETISLGVGFVCQFKCCYCTHIQQPADERIRYTKRIIDFTKFLKARGIVDDKTRIGIANGEISINPLQAEIIDIFYENPCSFLTNAQVYSPLIEKVLGKGKSLVNVSLDSGTPETFELVKGFPSKYFEGVCENIRRYAQHGPLELKYILIPGKNSGVSDIEGFLKLAEETRAKIILSRDLLGIPHFNENLETALSAASMLINGAKGRGLDVRVPKEYKELFASHPGI